MSSPEDDSDESPTTCPSCGDEFTAVATHWSRSNKCDHEPLDTKHHEILRGLLLVKGWVATDSQTPSIYVKTNDVSALRWLDDAFGIFSNGIRQTHTAEEVRAGMADLTFDLPEDAEPDPMYQWALMSHPDIEQYAEDWYEVDESGTRTKRVPETVERTPRTLRTWHIAGGRLERPGKATRSRAVFSITSIPAATETLEALMEPFEPRVYAASEMANHDHESLVLYDTAAFFDYIRAPPRPRFREKWPDPDEALLGGEANPDG